MKSRMVFIVIFLSGFSAEAKWELLVRADQNNPYQLPVNTKMPNMNVACSDSQLAVRYWQVEDQVYSGVKIFDEAGSATSEMFSENVFLSSPNITGAGVIFAANTISSTLGLFHLSVEKGQAVLKLNKDLRNSQALTSPSWWRDQFLVRRKNNTGSYELWSGNDQLLKENETLKYIHLPQVRGRQFTLKVSLLNDQSQEGSEIWSYQSLAPNVLVSDRSIDAQSPFLSFDNSPQPTGDGGVVFFATHANFGRSLWLKNKAGALSKVAEESVDGLIKKLEYFSPQANQRGDVLFRGILQNGKRAIFQWNQEQQGVPLAMIIEGDKVFLNDGVGRVIARDGWPAFSGRPCLTDGGDIFVHAVLESIDGQYNFGSGVFKYFPN